MRDESGDDPWAWLHATDADAPADLNRFAVVAAILPVGDHADDTRCREAVDDSEAGVESIRDDLPGDAEGDWFWLLPADTQPAPGALGALLERVRREPDAAVVGALLVEPRRRGAGTLVSDWAQTISRSGRLRPLTEPGELYQGQLEAVPALGVPVAGMLVRGDAWRFLGGLNADLPRSHQGLDFGWRANLAGYRVVAEPGAQIVDRSALDDPADERAAGLALVSGNTAAPRRWLTSLRLVVTCLATALGYLLGKDPERAGEEVGGLWRWLTGRRLRHSVTDRLAALPVTPAARATTRALRPSRWAGLRRAGEQLAARLSEWLQTFSGRGAAVSLDEMTGDDFAETGTTRYRVPLALSGVLALLAAALVAARTAFGTGSLAAAQLLPAPSGWTELMAAYLAPVPGSAGVAGAPWAGLAAVFSLLTLGRPEWLVTGTLVLTVPLAWLMALRLLRQLVADKRLAALGALAYALGPVLLGGLNAGAFGLAATALLLPVLGYSARQWLAGRDWSWRRAGAVAFWMLLACALVPLFWPAGLLAAALTARRGRAWAQWGLVLAAPLLLLLGPWGATLLAHPGRLLTGIEPQLAPSLAPEPWTLLVGHTVAGAAPLWLSIAFFALLWLAAVAGAGRRPGSAGPALACAGLVAVVAVGITRLVVSVPPGTWVRPQALEWQLALVAALVVAACTGLDGVTAELQGRDLGARHLGGLGLAVACAAVLLAGTGWWLLAGQVLPARGPVGAVPAFVRNAQVSTTPGRTLALVAAGTEVRWSLLEGGFARLGDAERGMAFGGDGAAKQLAASVAARLVGDSADDQLAPDLRTLGVAHVVLAGGSPEQRLAIDNVPGLALGTGDPGLVVWPVPGSAIAVTTGPDGAPTPVGQGAGLVPGTVLHLAEPADPRWVVTAGGTPLAAVEGGAPATRFAVTAAGPLAYRLDDGPLWWAWVQLAGLGVLAILAAPAVRRRNEAAAPRRIAGGGA